VINVTKNGKSSVKKKGCLFFLTTLVLFLLSCNHDRNSKDLNEKYWTSSWATALKVATPGFDPPLPKIKNITVRQTVKISGGGEEIRIWLSNEFGNSPLKIAGVTVAKNLEQGLIEVASLRRVLFDHNDTVSILPGERISSDPIKFSVKDLSEVAVSIYLPDDVSDLDSPISYHVRALQTNYIAPGKQIESARLKNSTAYTSYFFLAALDVKSQGERAVIATFGDSIMDGDQAADAEPIGENARFNNFLANLISKNERQASVVNLGISGNQITQSFLGEKPLKRFDRDILSVSGLTHVIFLAGINDIGLPGLLNSMEITAPEVTAEQIISEHKKIVAKIKQNGLVAIGGTLTPSGGFAAPAYFEEASNAKRQIINDWIRNSGSYDYVVDFDAVLRDTSKPHLMKSELSADGLHPNSAGYQKMADAVYVAIESLLPLNP